MHALCVGTEETVGTAGHFVVGDEGVTNGNEGFANHVCLVGADGVKSTRR